MSNATGDQHPGIPAESAANPYEHRFRLPDPSGQLAGWVAEIDQPATAEDLPSTAELRELLEGKRGSPQDQYARWARWLIVAVALAGALYVLSLIGQSLLGTSVPGSTP